MLLLTLFTLALAERDDTVLLQSRSFQYHAVSAEAWKRLSNKSAPAATAVLPNPEQVSKAMKAHEEVAQRQPERQLPSCHADLRNSLPACMQYTPDWCWATVTAQLAGYFDPSHVPESGDYQNLGTGGLHVDVQKSESCLGEECRIVGSQFAPSIMGACCSEDVEPKRSSFTCDNGADVRTIEKAIQWATGQTYVAKEGPMQEEELINVLNKGHPVPYAVLWVDKETGMYRGGHIMILGGCTGDGKYYLHDSLSNLTRTDTWQTLSHSELLDYNPYAMVDFWPQTEKIESTEVHQASSKQLKSYCKENCTLGRWFYSFVLSKDLYNLGMSIASGA